LSLDTERTRRRRQHLATVLGEHPLTRAAGGPPAVVLFAHPMASRNSDVDHPYRADSDIAYLTGFEEPESALVILPGRAEGEAVLFVRARDPEREVWDGRRAGPEGAVSTYGVDEAFPIGELQKRLPGLLKGRSSVWMHAGRRADDDAKVFGAVATTRRRCRKEGRWPRSFCDLDLVLSPMRHIKDDAELALLERAAEASVAGHRRAMAVSRPGVNEGDLEAVLSYEFRRGGAARHGYEPIVATGDNACILHYIENDATLGDGELVLIDAGAEVGLYTADITRTFPANGKFSEAQRELYEIVLAANEASIAASKPGATMRELDAISRRVLADGLVRIGLLEGDIETLTKKVPFEDMPEGHPGKAPLDRFYMHSTGHWLGSDVHDVGAYHDGERQTELLPGMVFTIEPGLYVPKGSEDVPERYHGIGIRIEDDIVVTSDGHRNLTAGVPKDIAGIEALVGTEEL
jgi:Xaa-Pro aminopeptidase